MNDHRPPAFVRVLLGWPGMVAAAAWGFAEATLFFVVPDVFLTLTAMFSIRRSLAHLGAVTAGAVGGGALMFLWAASGPGARTAVERVPFVRPAMFERIDRGYEASGAAALVEGPMSGIPYKAYAVEAPRYTTLGRFLLWSVPARLERFVITWVIFAALGLLIRTRRRNFAHLAIGLHLAYWCCVYTAYWITI